MKSHRRLTRVTDSRPTTDGAGVRLRRAFSHDDVKILDPFLMLDHFGSDKVSDFKSGFPLHPHRGIETVTYVIDGSVEHRDSLGNQGKISRGGVQWMTAGRGILHEEMPKGKRLDGFQLWVNLPSRQKMMPPRYQDVPAEKLGRVKEEDGSEIIVIAGKYGMVHGPVKELVIPVTLLDVHLVPNAVWEMRTVHEDNAFVYVYQGRVDFGPDGDRYCTSEQLGILGKGSLVSMRAGEEGARFLIASGQPIGESIAWAGPIVMNTQKELQQAFTELDQGTFVRSP